MYHYALSMQHSKLTPRESEVMELIKEGKSNQEISDILCIGVNTVKTHVSKILSKKSLPSRLKLMVE